MMQCATASSWRWRNWISIRRNRITALDCCWRFFTKWRDSLERLLVYSESVDLFEQELL